MKMSNQTHIIIKELEGKGFNHEQATAIIEAVVKLNENSVVSKSDLKDAVHEIQLRLTAQDTTLMMLTDSVKSIATRINGLYITVIAAVVVMIITKYLPALPHG